MCATVVAATAAEAEAVAVVVVVAADVCAQGSGLHDARPHHRHSTATEQTESRILHVSRGHDPEPV